MSQSFDKIISDLTVNDISNLPDSPLKSFILEKVNPKKTKSVNVDTSKATKFDVVKTNQYEQTITGIVLKPEKRDADNDIYSSDVVRIAAHKFMINSQAIGENHDDSTITSDFVVVENWLTPMEMTKSDLNFDVDSDEIVPEGTWIATVKILDDDKFQDILDGKYGAFSITGTAQAIIEDEENDD